MLLLEDLMLMILLMLLIMMFLKMLKTTFIELEEPEELVKKEEVSPLLMKTKISKF